MVCKILARVASVVKLFCLFLAFDLTVDGVYLLLDPCHAPADDLAFTVQDAIVVQREAALKYFLV